MKSMILAIMAALLMLFTVLAVGCAPQVDCASPSKVISNRCCVDANDNDICDSEESEPESEPEIAGSGPVVETEPEPVAEPESEPEIAGSGPVVETEPEPVAESEPAPAELKAGRSYIKFGEPKKYLEINDLKFTRYSADKVRLDELWYTLRNIGPKPLNPEVRIRFEGVRTTGSEYDQESSDEKVFNLETLEPGEKEVVRLYLGTRYSRMNKTKTINMEVLERYVAPKEVLDDLEYKFVPRDELDSMEIISFPGD